MEYQINKIPVAYNRKNVAICLDKIRESLAFKESEEIKNFYEKEYKENPHVSRLIDCIFGNSPYLSKCVCDFPEILPRVWKKGLSICFYNIINEIKKNDYDKVEDIEKDLRVKKREISLIVAVGDLTSRWQLEKVTESLSIFADVAVAKVTEFLLKKYHNNKTISLQNPAFPVKNSGVVVIGMGKLGAYELNYSSDIDLIVFFEDGKLKYSGRRSINSFYISFAQEMTDILSRRTREGYVFRVDMRLRPDPASNPLAVSLEKAENYYFTVGQNWERAAMIKSRFYSG